MLLAVTDRRAATAAAPVVQQALARWGSALPMNVGTLLQRRGGVTARMLRDWSEGSSHPSLPQFLRLCRVLELSAADLLWSDAPALRSQLALQRQPLMLQPRLLERTVTSLFAIRMSIPFVAAQINL